MKLKRILKIVLLVVAVLVLIPVGILLSVFVGKAPIPNGMQLDGVEVVKDGMVSAYVVDLGPGEVALVDAGNDAAAKAILAALAKRGLGADAVKAVLLTHGDEDHVRGAVRFPQATLMALESDVALAEGRAVRMPLRSPHPTGLRVTRTLSDGETVELGGTRIDVFAIPGHTPGSAAFLARGVLFLGDSAEVGSNGKLEPAAWLFCSDRPKNLASLKALARRLVPRAAEVKAIACSHSGVLTRGLIPLGELAASPAR